MHGTKLEGYVDPIELMRSAEQERLERAFVEQFCKALVSARERFLESDLEHEASRMLHDDGVYL
jgi:hypothetical protein